MKSKTFLYNVLIYLAYMAAVIVSIFLTSVIAAYITSLFTDDVNTIITVTLVSLWIVMIILYIIRNRIFYKRKIKSLASKPNDIIEKEKKYLRKRYFITLPLYIIISGLIFYNLKPILIKNIYEQHNTQSAHINNPYITSLKYIMLTIVIGFWVYKKYRDRKFNC